MERLSGHNLKDVKQRVIRTLAGAGIMFGTSVIGAGENRPGKVEADPGPQVTILRPEEGSTMPSVFGEVWWATTPEVTQMHLQLIPFKNDGPGINLYWGDKTRIDRGSLSSLPLVTGNRVQDCIALPGMGYKWRIRVSDSKTKLSTEQDAGWTGWNERGFRTPSRDSARIVPVKPSPGEAVLTKTPRLFWNNTREGGGAPDVFYYEIQVSKDPNFETDPQKATAAVTWEYVNACSQEQPFLFYQVKPQYPLEPNSTYHWRLRPRIQGDGTPVKWSESWTFKTPRFEEAVEPLIDRSELTDWAETVLNNKKYRIETRYVGSSYKVTIDPGQKQKLIDVVSKDGERHEFTSALLFVLADRSQAPEGTGFNFNSTASQPIGWFGAERFGDRLTVYFVPEADLDLNDPSLNRTLTRRLLENTITGGNVDPFSSPLVGKQEHGGLVTGQALRIGFQEISK